MRELLDQSLEQGAIGMSSGLFYAVSNAASTDEVAEVAQPLGKWGGVYTAHMRDEGDHILKAMDETFEIGRRAGAEIIVSHHKCSGRSNFGRMTETLPKFTEAMKQQQIAFDVYPYIAGSTILRTDMLERADKVLITWSDKVPGMSGRDLTDIAREMGCSMKEAGDRLQPAGAIYFMMDEKDVQAAMSHPGAMIGSDGIPFDAHPHPRLWGTFPRVLGHYSRDLKLFPLEDAVRRMTSYSAQRFHLTGRGEVKAGYYADLCVFDPATVIDTATFEKPMTPAAGIDTVLCNGAIVWRDGKPGGGRSGRALNRQQMQDEAKSVTLEACWERELSSGSAQESSSAAGRSRSGRPMSVRSRQRKRPAMSGPFRFLSRRLRRGGCAPCVRGAPAPRPTAWRSGGLRGASARSARRSPRNSRRCPPRSTSAPTRSWRSACGSDRGS